MGERGRVAAKGGGIMNRVVITGMGAITPIGNDVASYWSALLAGTSGTGPVTSFDASAFPTRIAGSVRGFNPEEIVDKKEARRTSRFILFALKASLEALADAGLDIAPIAEKVGIEIGSGIGGIEILEQTALTLFQKGPDRVSPFTVPMMIPDMAAGLVA
ncbi:beta-ketoacyl-[acyl-carrier-protein] synthase II, partial [bacterium]|nr:beta-ketoacyl-[acyl-carrier-protein] synthase II [bacterium]